MQDKLLHSCESQSSKSTADSHTHSRVEKPISCLLLVTCSSSQRELDMNSSKDLLVSGQQLPVETQKKESDQVDKTESERSETA